MKEFMDLTGSVHVQLFDENGNIKQEHTDRNLIVTVGKTYLAAWLAAASQAGKFMSYIGVGDGGGGPVAGDVGLASALSPRVLGTLTSATNTWQNQATFAPTVCTGAITEAGLFDALTTGTMFARQVFAVYNKAAGDTLIVTWTVTFS